VTLLRTKLGGMMIHTVHQCKGVNQYRYAFILQ